MNIYPAIDILGGKAVRLRQGRRDDATVYGLPLEMAQRWVERGAEWIHVVDLDGAFEGAPRNQSVLSEILSAFPGVRIQLGGGIRNLAVLNKILEAGVQRAVLGTSAVTDTEFVAQAIRRWPGRIAIGIDARDGVAKVSGWTSDSSIAATDLARRLQDLGAELVIYTDIARDGVLTGPNVTALMDMLEATRLNVIASGGISKTDDVRALVDLRQPRLDGVIIGKALYEGLVELGEVLEMEKFR